MVKIIMIIRKNNELYANLHDQINLFKNNLYIKYEKYIVMQIY